MKAKTKEQTYDEEINPLMAQILEICKREKIAMVASFSIPTPEDPDLMCTSALTTEEYQPTRDQKAAVSILIDGFVAFTRSRR